MFTVRSMAAVMMSMDAAPQYNENSSLANFGNFWLGSKTQGGDLGRGVIEWRMRQQLELLLHKEVQHSSFGCVEPLHTSRGN